MQSRRDQVQAHLFVMGRVSAGLLRAEPDAPDSPTGRTNRGAVIGLAVALLIGLGAGVYGLVKPGGATGWRKAGTVVVVKETGTRYLFAGGQLHPVLNQASARLLSGDQLKVDEVSRRSLEGTDRGTAVGIVGAPDGVPAPADLDRSDWLACTVQAAGGPAGRAAPLLSLAVGSRPGGLPAGDRAALVAGPDGVPHLLWHGRRYALDVEGGAVRALGYAAATPAPVPAAFLQTFAPGPDLRRPELPGRGTAGPDLSGRKTRVGQLVAGAGEDRYVLTAQGLVQVSTTLLALLQGDPRTQEQAYGGGAVTVDPVGAADLAAHSAPAAAAAEILQTNLPARPPGLVPVGAGQALCAGLATTGAGEVDLRVLDATAVLGLPPTTEPGVVPSCTPADRIAVRPGGGALVRALSGAGQGSTLYLVTDNGVRYPLAPAAAERLGLAGAAPVAVPGRLLSLLPTGPSLDPAALTGTGLVQPPATDGKCAR
ncbi:type VII secretion protein EccB [Kitasatospora sp. NPDC089913]|uniref:type VII secretion protein EccB n=1 Tax=Streptomycetaceae TaxID=2062 RepID=UPI00087A8569|nr:type VII secretion protein EccB [Streptomyces sp. TLI_053]SDT81486.1 type VII secretion protein EccB [Streptomyces sp. TLI_053]